MFWFNIILGMDWLASNYTSIDYSKKEVVFKPPKGDPIGRRILDWRKRVHIIEGIIQGLLYLQEYSNFTIIHRDLKGSNILLDKDMNPKISDFGIAILFGKDEHEANTNRIVGT
ncbi:hypothetical protein I3842_15G160700 [Carya illinoinensis]|uniref:non-specific serine/threonine protein kinase n=1 Tax=Carya illinoinensis TaxID=32201 RepID=A0A922D7T0_CARIL|nr:hypothetical protein I3842_15G160700 [Carya illinoinensis]